jgi:hypothetical protein
MSNATISLERARQHEALVLKLEALMADVRKLAAKSPEGAVGERLRAAAEGLLHDAQKFRVRGRREKLPVAPATFGALALELAQARARLEAFELAHSYWSAAHKAHVWRVANQVEPIRRLRPALAAADPEQQKANRKRMDEVLQMMMARVERAYNKGYEDGRSGRAPSPDGPWPPGIRDELRNTYRR